MESGGRWDGDNGLIWYGYLWKKNLGESCLEPPIQWRWNPGSWEPGSLQVRQILSHFCTPPKTPKKLKKNTWIWKIQSHGCRYEISDSVTLRSVCWKFRGENIDAANTSRFRQDRISLWHPTSSNILFLFVRFHVCVCCWFFIITNLWDENSYVCNIPQTFASARASMKSSCPDSSHWKRLVPASCLLSHPCPSPTRRYSTPSLSNLWHLCHSCHLFLQHHKKLFQILTRQIIKYIHQLQKVSNLEKFPYQSDFKNQISSHL